MSQKNNIESMRPMNGISSMSPVKPMRLISPMSSFFLITMGLLLAGCQSDSLEPDGNRQRTSVELLSYSSPFVDVAPWVTRATSPTAISLTSCSIPMPPRMTAPSASS